MQAESLGAQTFLSGFEMRALRSVRSTMYGANRGWFVQRLVLLWALGSGELLRFRSHNERSFCQQRRSSTSTTAFPLIFPASFVYFFVVAITAVIGLSTSKIGLEVGSLRS